MHPGHLLWLGSPILVMSALAAMPTGGGPTLCPFALMTGLACPGCGLTRAAAALVRADLGAALELHPLVPVAMAWLAGAWVVGVMRQRGGGVALPPGVVARLLSLTGVLLMLTWLLRLVTGTLPPV